MSKVVVYRHGVLMPCWLVVPTFAGNLTQGSPNTGQDWWSGSPCFMLVYYVNQRGPSTFDLRAIL